MTKRKRRYPDKGNIPRKPEPKDEFLIDPNVTPWARSFVNVVHAFREAHEMDKMIATNIYA